MKKTIQNLVAIPLLTVSSLAAVILHSYSTLHFVPLLFYLILSIELLLAWDRSLPASYQSDFRYFYASQARYVYVQIILSASWIIASVAWGYLSYFGLTLFLLGISYRSMTHEGLTFLERSNVVPISNVRSQLCVWDQNKLLCRQIVDQYRHSPLTLKIMPRIEYSSFLRTQEASVLLNKIGQAIDTESIDVMLSELLDKMS